MYLFGLPKCATTLHTRCAEYGSHKHTRTARNGNILTAQFATLLVLHSHSTRFTSHYPLDDGPCADPSRDTRPFGPERHASNPFSRRSTESKGPTRRGLRPGKKIMRILDAHPHARAPPFLSSKSPSLIMANIGCTTHVGCCRPTTVEADRCKALLEVKLLRCPPVTGPDRSHSLLLQTRVSSSPSASGILTRQNPLVACPLASAAPSQKSASCHLLSMQPRRRTREGTPSWPGRPASAPGFA